MTVAMVAIHDGKCILGSDSLVMSSGKSYVQKITILGDWAIAIAGSLAGWSWLQYNAEVRDFILSDDCIDGFGINQIGKLWRAENTAGVDCDFIFVRCGKAWNLQNDGAIEPVTTIDAIGDATAAGAAFWALWGFTDLPLEYVVQGALESVCRVSAYCGGEVVMYDCSDTPRRI